MYYNLTQKKQIYEHPSESLFERSKAVEGFGKQCLSIKWGILCEQRSVLQVFYIPALASHLQRCEQEHRDTGCYAL